MPENDLVTTEAVIVEEHHWFTLVSLCQASGADPDQVHALVGEGLLLPAGQRPDDWRFGGGALAQTRRALRLARDFELSIPAVVLVMDLLAEIDSLRSSLRRR